jgi:hypothetical protein
MSLNKMDFSEEQAWPVPKYGMFSEFAGELKKTMKCLFNIPTGPWGPCEYEPVTLLLYLLSD